MYPDGYKIEITAIQIDPVEIEIMLILAIDEAALPQVSLDSGNQPAVQEGQVVT